jgi:hypothetical protein
VPSRNWKASVAVVALIMTFAAIVFAQQGGGRGQGGGQRGAAQPALPTPRGSDGKPLLGPIAGEKGIWLPAAGGAERMTNPDAPAAGGGGFGGGAGGPQFPRPKTSEIPFQPWARALYDYRGPNQLEPHTRCKPSGGPRQFLTPYGVEFVNFPELQRIFIFDIGGPHTYRIIFMDGRPHPKDLPASYYGHSIGRWEGDTLIVDTVGFNERFWIDRTGLPTTEKLHLIEKFTRTDMNTMGYEVTVDDPGAYTAVWKGGFYLRWTPNEEMFEYVCQDNNYAGELMVGAAERVDRRSQIVP